MRATSVILLTAAIIGLASNVHADNSTTKNYTDATFAYISGIANKAAEEWAKNGARVAAMMPDASTAKNAAVALSTAWKSMLDANAIVSNYETEITDAENLTNAALTDAGIISDTTTLATAQASLKTASAAGKAIADKVKKLDGVTNVVTYTPKTDIEIDALNDTTIVPVVTDLVNAMKTLKDLIQTRDTKIQTYNNKMESLIKLKLAEANAVKKCYERTDTTDVKACVDGEFVNLKDLPISPKYDASDLSTYIEAVLNQGTNASTTVQQKFSWDYEHRTEIDKVDKDLFKMDKYVPRKCEVSIGTTKQQRAIDVWPFALVIFNQLASSLEVDPILLTNQTFKTNNTDDSWCDEARRSYFFTGLDTPEAANSFYGLDKTKCPTDGSIQKVVDTISRKCFHYIGDARTLVVSVVATTVATVAIVASFL